MGKPTEIRLEPGSFRDRNSRVVYQPDGNVQRLLNETAYGHWQALQAAPFFAARQTDGSLIGTRYLGRPPAGLAGDSEERVAVLEHDRINFVSYAYEWPFHMLREAAVLHLDLMLDALQADLILKDATPYNIQWQGTRPVFIDIPSFESLAPGDAWIGYRQFCCLFLYPLMLQAYKNIPYHAWLRGSLEGISPSVMQAHMSSRDLLRRGVFTHVNLQSRLEQSYSGSQQNIRHVVKNAGFQKAMIRNNVANLRRLVSRLDWHADRSTWSHYAGETSYDAEQTRRKDAFVERAVASRQEWNLVWDLGANTGRYSRIAAERARTVIAMDADHLAVDRMYRELRTAGDSPARKILPLVVNLGDPAPALGWRGQERKSLPQRGSPDLILSLALIHHVVISANIPLREFVEWTAEFGAALVIEFVSREDEMVQTLLRNKDDQYSDYDREYFEQCLSDFYDVREHEELKNGRRIIYFALPK